MGPLVSRPPHRGVRTTGRITTCTACTAAVALAVAGVAVSSASADGPNTAVAGVRLTGAAATGQSVVVRAVDNSGTLGAGQATRALPTVTTGRDGTATVRADPAALADLADDGGYVNFESEVRVAGEPRFTSFSRRWTGTDWVDPDGRPAMAAPALSPVTAPVAPEPPAVVAEGGEMTDVVEVRATAADEVPCTWYDDSAGNASTVIGEFHTGANSKGYFTYGTTSDSDISVGYNYGRGWSVGGSGHVGNSKASFIRFNVHSGFHHHLRSTFRYVHWHLTLGASCAAPNRWGQRYQKVTPASWQSGSEVGALVAGKFCTGASGRRSFARNSDFYRGSRRAYTYGTAAKAWGASLSATSGFSKFVDINYHFGDSKSAPHYLCGRPDILSSKIIYAR
jgi:hypothetical protein